MIVVVGVLVDFVCSGELDKAFIIAIAAPLKLSANESFALDFFEGVDEKAGTSGGSFKSSWR